jgi:hypothetical protein
VYSLMFTLSTYGVCKVKYRYTTQTPSIGATAPSGTWHLPNSSPENSLLYSSVTHWLGCILALNLTGIDFAVPGPSNTVAGWGVCDIMFLFLRCCIFGSGCECVAALVCLLLHGTCGRLGALLL